jgi:hypothetical protein
MGEGRAISRFESVAGWEIGERRIQKNKRREVFRFRQKLCGKEAEIPGLTSEAVGRGPGPPPPEFSVLQCVGVCCSVFFERLEHDGETLSSDWRLLGFRVRDLDRFRPSPPPLF